MLNKQTVNIKFSQGLDTKTDPYQVTPGKFLSLQNTIFTKGGLLQKRNGYVPLPTLPSSGFNFLTTFNGDLTAIGIQLDALSAGYNSWVYRGNVQPLNMSVFPLIRNNTNQSQCDSVVSEGGLICTVYTDQNPSNLSASIYKYVVADATTGQNIIQPTVITNADTVYGAPKVFLLGAYFVVVYTAASPYPLQYIAISTMNPTAVIGPTNLSTSSTPSLRQAFDGVVSNNTLFYAWNGASATGINVAYMTNTLSVAGSIVIDSVNKATLMSVTADELNSLIWLSYYNSATSTGFTLAMSPALGIVLAPTSIISSGTILNITSSAQNGLNYILYETSNTYSYDSSIPTNYVNSSVIKYTGTLVSTNIIKRSIGLASKSFILNGLVYFLGVYQSPYQPTYFLLDFNGNIIAKLAYENAGGYLTHGLPSVSVDSDDNEIQFPYLYKDLIQAVNTNTAIPAGSQTAGIYSQTGINLATIIFATSAITSAEIGTNLNISGGFLWAYDGYSATEQGFFLYPDSVEATWSATGGSIHAQPDGSTNTNAYYYQCTYEWTDNQGNAFRSAPSIPVAVTTSGTGTSGSISISIPYLRLTYKTANPVKICVYRWSVAQEVYYEVTTITAPILNSIGADSVTFVDTFADATILGNALLYTTGGVLEDISPPSFSSVFIFDDRLWGITSEDPNLLWYSKQVLEATPVEMSDLLTIYVNPNVGAQGPTGPLKCGAAMDDKLILFKASAMNYINGTGPDNTGVNGQYSPPIFITSTVGCSNQRSIVFQPQGLMFEFHSESGNQIWLLGRDLSTQYIGAPVEQYTLNYDVLSAVNIPGTNQVRFTMSSGVTLIYDYYYHQWGTFINVPAISSTVYNGLHTYINDAGQTYQESPGSYLDDSNPVLMSFTTSWFNLAGLQGYQRAYMFYLLGTYYTPHNLVVQIAYDYDAAPTQQSIISPANFSPVYGGGLTYGSDTPYGGGTALEQWRVFLARQRCQSFQLQISEIFNPAYRVLSGRRDLTLKGFTLSGLDLVVGIKKGYRPIAADHSVG